MRKPRLLTHRKWRWPLGLVATAMACNLPGLGTPSPAPASPEPGAVSSPTRVTPTPPPEPPLPLSDLSGVLERGVDTGRWTQTGGVIVILRLLAGEIPEDQALPAEGVVRGAGTGVLALARQLVEGDDLPAEDRTEIERLLSLIVPSTDDLDLFSELDPTASGRTGMMAPPTQDDECETIWREAWAPDPLTTCFLRREFDGHRVYYPATWAADLTRLPYVDAAQEAVQTSQTAYTGLGLRVPPVYLVFSLLTGDRLGGRRSWYAAASSWLRPCPILVYPPGLDSNLERYKQILAHEMFHCVQGENLPAQMSVGTPTYDWWVEGTAEYFANVAFPDADAENEYLDAFDENSQSFSILEMAYENFLFFQHWANEAGNAAIVEFLRGLPGGGGIGEQRSALGAAPDIQDRFHRFGQLYMDRNIEDAGGDLVPVSPSLETIAFEVTTMDAIPPSPDFVLKRYGLLFPEERDFDQALGQDGAEGKSSARPAGAGEAWGPLPDALRTGCDPFGYYLVVTTANGEGEEHHLILDVTVEEKPGCDECLGGHWVADNATYEEYFRARAGDDTGFVLEGIAGEMWAEFRADNTGAWGYNGFAVDFMQVMTNLAGERLEIGTTLRFEGGGTNVYYAGDGIVNYEETTNDIEIGVSVAGQEITLAEESTGLAGAEAGRDIFEAGVPYVCTEREARFGPVAGAPTDLIVWRRTGP